MNFANKDEVIKYSENSEGESNDLHRTATSRKINTPEITTPVPSGHQTSFGRPVDVNMKSRLHIDVHWTSKRRLMPTGL